MRLCAVFTNCPRMAGRSSEGVRVFTSTASQHGGQAITSFHRTLLHQGMIIAGAQYSKPRLVAMTEITGGRPTALPRSLRPIAASFEERVGHRPLPWEARRRDRRSANAVADVSACSVRKEN